MCYIDTRVCAVCHVNGIYHPVMKIPFSDIAVNFSYIITTERRESNESV